MPEENVQQLIQIAQLERQLFPDDAWTVSSIAELLQADINHNIVLEKAGQLLGYCLYQIVFETAEILRIGVKPTLQHQGIGTQLLQRLLATLSEQSVEKLLLEVRADNEPAIHFYQKHGFTTIHVRKNYYQLNNGNRINALIMQKMIVTPARPPKSSDSGV